MTTCTSSIVHCTCSLTVDHTDDHRCGCGATWETWNDKLDLTKYPGGIKVMPDAEDYATLGEILGNNVNVTSVSWEVVHAQHTR